MQYWDTSTLAKLYLAETDSAQFASHISTTAIYTSELARWELLRAIVRKEVEGAIPSMGAELVFAKFRSDVKAGRIVLLPVDGAVEKRFRTLVPEFHRAQPPIMVRTFDAIHLATAVLLPATEMIATDQRMREGGKALGLRLFP